MFHEEWLPLLLTGLSAAAAAYAASRLHRLNRHVAEPRLRRLTWFFTLFAAALTIQATETLFLATLTVRARDALTLPAILFLLRHLLLTTALVAAVAAVGIPHRPHSPHGQAPVTIALVQLTHPVILLTQGILLFYLVVRSAANHARRAEPGSLRVALGFLLLLAAHLVPFINQAEGPPPLGTGDAVTAAVLLIGTLVLASIVHHGQPGNDERREPTG